MSYLLSQAENGTGWLVRDLLFSLHEVKASGLQLSFNIFR